MALPANRVSKLMRDLLHWLEIADQPPLIASCVCHYGFEFIHPFADGNGRMGRLWQTLILSRWRSRGSRMCRWKAWCTRIKPSTTRLSMRVPSKPTVHRLLCLC